MPKISKFIISILAAITLLLSFTPVVAAQGLVGQSGPWYSQSFDQWYTKVYNNQNPNEIFGERYTAAQVSWIFYGIVALAINLASGNNPAIQQCIVAIGGGNVGTCTKPPLINLSMDKGDKNKGLASLIFADRDLSGITYVKDIGRKFNLIPKAQAQGFGYSGALGLGGNGNNTIQKAWTVVRDLSYGIFVIVIIVMAFLIMFRVKISPQVVISVQSALPKIAVALILVTFSYAIAGFLIDIMYVVIGVISLIFSNITVAGVQFNLGSGATASANAITGYFDLLTKGPVFLGIHFGIFGLLIMYIVNYIIAYVDIVFAGLFGIFKLAPGESVLALVTFVVGLIGLILVFIVAIINFFKVVFLLGQTFLMIILLTIFAPLQFAFSVVIPGIGLGSWVKNYAAKLATFVGVGVMFILSLWVLQFAVDSANNPSPTAFPQGWPPLLGGSPQLLGLGFLIASIAMFMMIPRVGHIIESFVAGKAFNFESAIGEATNPLGVRRLATETAGTYFGNVLYNPRGGGGAIPDLVNRAREGLRDRFTPIAGGPPEDV